MSETNWWGGQMGESVQPTNNTENLVKTNPEVSEIITEGDRIRARVAVSRGESTMYFIKTPPCDFSDLETHQAGGNVFEIVYNGTVFGYTTDENSFGTKQEIKYH